MKNLYVLPNGNALFLSDIRSISVMSGVNVNTIRTPPKVCVQTCSKEFRVDFPFGGENYAIQARDKIIADLDAYLESKNKKDASEKDSGWIMCCDVATEN